MGIQFTLQRQRHTTLARAFVELLGGRRVQPKEPKAAKETLWVLRGISLSVCRGESVGIIGRNGAGKSTLLQVLAGIYKPDEGAVERKCKVSLLQIGTGFHPDLTGRDNIYLNGTILGLRKREIDVLFDSIVAFSELDQFIDVPIKSYSAGMCSRLGFSIAINISPDILLVDEVLAAGDENFRNKCYKKLEEVTSDGRAIIFVSHSMREVQRLCKRVINLDNGRILREGSSEDVIPLYLEMMNKDANVHTTRTV